MEEFDDRSDYFLTGGSSDGEAEASSAEIDFTEEEIWDSIEGSGGGGGGGGGGGAGASLSRIGSHNGRRPWAAAAMRSAGGDGMNEYSRGGGGGGGLAGGGAAGQFGRRNFLRGRGRGGDVGNESDSVDDNFESFANSSSGGGGGEVVGGMRRQDGFSGAAENGPAGGQGVPILRSGQQRSTLIGGGHREQMPRFRQSAPVAVPQWSHNTSGCNLYPENDVEAWERDVPPQEYFDIVRAPDRRQLAFSNLEGRGRTLRGRDALSLRDTVWRNIGLDA